MFLFRKSTIKVVCRLIVEHEHTHAQMTTLNTISVNQTSRLARIAVKKEVSKRSEVEKPHDSTEPVSNFAKFVEKKAFASNNKTSVIYNTTGEQFPYLKNFENDIGFAFETPALLAAIYITARSNPTNWHLISAREDTANYAPSENVVEKVNAYFKVAGEPLSDELHEIHMMIETFLHPSDRDLSVSKRYFGNDNLNTLLFSAVSSKFDSSQIDQTLRKNIEAPSAQIATNPTTYEFIFRTFSQKTSWFTKQ